MHWSQLWQLLVDRRKFRQAAEAPVFMDFLEKSRLVTAVIFFVTVAAIVMISSVGVNTANLPVLPNQLAAVRISAAVPFSYVSQEQTRLARQQILDRVPPVYRLETAPMAQFEKAVRDLQAALNDFERKHPADGPSITDRRADLGGVLDAFNAHGPYRASLDDLQLLLAKLPADRRATLFEASLDVLREIYAEGVHDDSFGGSTPGNVTVFQIARPDGDVSTRPVQSMEEALTFLRVNLSGEDVPRDVSLALFRILRNGVTPNLVFDREATTRREAEAVRLMKPVVVNVALGQPIIEPGSRVTPGQYEMLMAHRKAMSENEATQLDEGLQLFGRILLVLAMVLATVFYVRLEDRETFQSNGRLGLLALVVILNITLVRAVYSIGSLDYFAQEGTWASTLPYVAPSAFAPLIVAILIDAGSAIFMALFISIFTGVIYGNRLDLLVLTFLASTVAIFACRDVRKRSRVVRAAGLG
ncbi:MAG: phosphohydrolase, partial [Opitutales bacterium]